MVYEPSEDSFLLAKHIPRYATGDVLEIGTGSGILANEASRYATVTAVDIDLEVIEHIKKTYPHIICIKSDLFENIKGTFDLIICNPPYLPMDEEDEKYFDLALYGGKHGWEIIERFLKKAKHYLKKNGKILLLISSLTNKDKVEELMKEKYNFTVIDEKKLDFERLYVYELS